MSIFPTVVLDEPCHGLSDVVRRFAPVILFSRSGGLSSDVPRAVAELHSELSSTPKKPPFLLVTASLGGFTAISFAHKYPSNMAGIILLDPSHPLQGKSALAILAKQDLPASEELEEFKSFFSRTNEAFDSGSREMEHINSIGDLPLLVLAAGGLIFPPAIPRPVRDLLVLDRHRMLTDFARLSNRGRIRVVPDAGHGMTAEAPGVVTKAIKDFIAILQND